MSGPATAMQASIEAHKANMAAGLKAIMDFQAAEAVLLRGGAEAGGLLLDDPVELGAVAVSISLDGADGSSISDDVWRVQALLAEVVKLNMPLIARTLLADLRAKLAPLIELPSAPPPTTQPGANS